jgi:hypothetical protein
VSDPVTGPDSTDANDQADLARSFRRLMIVYPHAYRAEREDEIVGVLLDCAEPGQHRPRLADALDLIRGGYRARLAMARSTAMGASLSDVLAALAVVVPFVFALLSAAPLLWARFGGPAVAGRDIAGVLAVELAGWALVSFCVATRRDRWSGGVALATGVATYALVARSILVSTGGAFSSRLIALAPGLCLFLLVAVVLLHGGSAERGRQLLGLPLVMCSAATLAAGSLVLVDLMSRTFSPVDVSIPGLAVVDAVALAVCGVAGAAAITMATRRGRRAWVSLGAVTAVCAMSPIAYYVSTRLYATAPLVELIEAAGIIAIPVAVAWLAATRRGPVTRQST